MTPRDSPGSPGQALKLYGGNRRATDEWTIAVDSGQYDAVLGRSYAQIAREGLRWQRSQGAGTMPARPGPQVAYYHLLATKLPAKPAKETSFLDGLEDQVRYQGAATAEEVARGLAAVKTPRQLELWQQALNQSLGIEVEALVQPQYRVVTPGQTFDVMVAFHARGNRSVQTGRLELVAPAGWKVVEKSPGLFNVTVPDRAAPPLLFGVVILFANRLTRWTIARASASLFRQLRYWLACITALTEARVSPSGSRNLPWALPSPCVLLPMPECCQSIGTAIGSVRLCGTSRVSRFRLRFSWIFQQGGSASRDRPRCASRRRTTRQVYCSPS